MQPSNKTSEIQWVGWGSDAFKKAAAENKPVLLAISAVWCHWCHVQDKTTYSNPEVVRIINRDYVAVRVDNDKRPDINRRYNMGGWPTTAFLTPNGDIITGGAYIPPEVMKDVLKKVRQQYLQSKDKSASKIASTEQLSVPVTGGLSKGVIDDVLSSVVMSFDPTYGGFGDQPKFPQTEALELALAQYWYGGDRGLLTVVTKTLDQMAAGGIYDREEGGFFRYSTTRDWRIPHYEKMCEDNSKHLTIYLHAYQVTGREPYRQLASELSAYVNRTLSDQENGGFYGSQDADEEYYRLALADRAKTSAPYVDRTIYTNWNGLMISAHLLAAPILNNLALREFALKSIQRVLGAAYDSKENVLHHYVSDGSPRVEGLLVDHVAFGEALVDAYQSTGDATYLKYAKQLVRRIDETLLDAENGGYYDSPPNPDSPGYLRRLEKPVDENSVASILLTRMYHTTGEETYIQRAKSTLEALSGRYQNYGYMAAIYALAVDLFLNEPTRIVIVGAKEEARTTELHEATLRAYEPRKLVVRLDPDIDKEQLDRLGYSAAEEPQAYICFGKTCLSPVTEPAEIARELSRHPRQ